MADFTVTNVSQLTNAWNNCSAGDRILIQSGTYNLGSTALGSLNSEFVEVIGYKTTLGDLGDVNDNWNTRFSSLDTTDFPKLNFSTSATYPVALTINSHMRNVAIHNSATSDNRGVYLAGNSTMVNCRVTSSSTTAGGTPAVVVSGSETDNPECCIYGCEIGLTNSSISDVSCVSLIRGGYKIMDKCRLFSNSPNGRLLAIGSTCFITGSVFVGGSMGLLIQNSITDIDDDKAVEVADCTFAGITDAVIVTNDAGLSSKTKSYRFVNNIFADCNRAFRKIHAGNNRPLHQINTRKLEITNVDDAFHSSLDQEFFTITGGSLEAEFIGRTSNDFRLKVGALSTNAGNFRNDRGALQPVKSRVFISGSHGS